MTHKNKVYEIVQKIIFQFLHSRYTPKYYQSPVVRGFINSHNEIIQFCENPYNLDDVLSINLNNNLVGSSYTLLLNEITRKLKKKLKKKPSMKVMRDILESAEDFFYSEGIYRYLNFLNSSTAIDFPEIDLFLNAAIICRRLYTQVAY